MDTIQQLRLKIIKGANNGCLSYSDSFDLMNITELQYLINMCKSNVIEGFIIEVSKIKKDEYINNSLKNEFIPLLEYIHADEKKTSFQFKGTLFQKKEYHIIRNSILDVNGDISLLLSTLIPNNIEESLKAITEIFKNNKDNNQKITCLTKKFKNF